MTVRVATLNIWNRMGPWEARLPAIRATLSSERVDVLALQEVIFMDDFDQACLVGEGIEDRSYHVARGRHSQALFPFGNAILSRFPIVRSEVFELPTGGTNERRTLLFAELSAPFGRMPVFVTHLNWKLDEGHVREEQVRFVADTVARVSAQVGSFPPVLMGDLNAEPEADEMRYLRGQTSLGGGQRVYFDDVWAYAGEGPGATFCRRNPFAAVAREPDRRIDYIYTRVDTDSGRGEPIEAHLAFDRPVGGVFPSDHFGVVATLVT